MGLVLPRNDGAGRSGVGLGVNASAIPMVDTARVAGERGLEDANLSFAEWEKGRGPIVREGTTSSAGPKPKVDELADIANANDVMTRFQD